MSPAAPEVRAGVAAFVVRDGKFLMGRRRGQHGCGSWSVPGGHIEYGETFEEAAKREVVEETGLIVEDLQFVGVTSDVFSEQERHYVTVWLIGECLNGDSSVLEPDKYDSHGWFDLEDLPEPLFLPWRQLLGSAFLQDLQARLGK
jgi:8-oxo-dGTP diphosphatase